MDDEFMRALKDSGTVRIALIGTLAILSLFLLAETLSVAQGLGRPGVPATDTVTVTGQGQATVPPDVARVSFSIEHRATTAAAAQTETTKQANAAIAFVREQGIEEKDIKTLSYNISPEYQYPSPCVPGAICPPRSPRIVGYQVSQTVEVTVRDLDKVNDLIAGLGSQNVQNLYGPSFALDDPTEGYDAARADAIMKAKKQAAELAKQLGVRLGKIVSFSESSGYYPYPVAYGMGGGIAETKAAPAPDIPSGENTYNATVTITYALR